MRPLLIALQLFSAVGVVVTVLMHAAKGEGLGGIGSAARIFGTPKGLEQGLDRLTWGFAIAFLSFSFLLALIKT